MGRRRTRATRGVYTHLTDAEHQLVTRAAMTLGQRVHAYVRGVVVEDAKRLMMAAQNRPWHRLRPGGRVWAVAKVAREALEVHTVLPAWIADGEEKVRVVELADGVPVCVDPTGRAYSVDILGKGLGYLVAASDIAWLGTPSLFPPMVTEEDPSRVGEVG